MEYKRKHIYPKCNFINLFYKIVFLSLCLIVFSCARIVTPKGGDKDTTAPKYVSSNPKQNSINFTGNRIDINFNEYIVLDNATGKLIVSPPLKNKPTIGSKLKTLYIKDLDSLAENTTYIFDFGDAITDFTEGNRLSHFSFAFSTGNHIDTLSYSGNIVNAYSLKPDGAKYVALYKNTDRKYIRENQPDYITRADSSGRFTFENIKEGDYLILAFEDQNQNMLYDLQTEGYGIGMCHVENQKANDNDSITRPKDNILFNSSVDTVQKIVSSKLLNQYELEIITSIPTTDSFNIQFTKPTIQQNDFLIYKNKSRDTITILTKKENGFDTLNATIIDNSFSEKIDLIFNDRKKRSDKEVKIFQFVMQKDSVAYFDNVKITFPYLINNNLIPNLSAKIIDGNDTISAKFKIDSLNPKVILLDMDLIQNKEYTLLIDSNAISDVRGYHNDKFSKVFHINSPDDYGSFVISVKDSTQPNQNLILSVFDMKNTQIGEDVFANADSRNIEFKNLHEGKYRLRAIIDENDNKKWDKGDFDKMTEPEKVMFFDKIISIRKGWQTVEEWILP